MEMNMLDNLREATMFRDVWERDYPSIFRVLTKILKPSGPYNFALKFPTEYFGIVTELEKLFSRMSDSEFEEFCSEDVSRILEMVNVVSIGKVSPELYFVILLVGRQRSESLVS